MNKQQISAFNRILKEECDSTTKAQPDIDKEFILTMDESDTGIGAILAQRDDQDRERMIGAFSKMFDKAQLSYSVTDKELLGIVKGIEHFRHYLLGKKFLLKTDHKALTYLWSATNPCSRILRWSLKLSEYNFQIQYIKGEDNVADGLSRIYTERTVNSLSKEELDVNEKKEILLQYHEASGHGSENTMKFMISQRYDWKNMYKDIENFCRSCKICVKSGGENICTKNKVIKSTAPNQLWEVDLVGRIYDEDGSKYIFVAIDHYSKWVETKVIQDKTAGTIYQAVEELIITKHGIPSRILSDNGLEFVNKDVQSLKTKYNFEWDFCSPYHHQTTEAVERVNQTLVNKIKKLSDFGRYRWWKFVGKATLGVNLSFNRAIGTSPYIFKYSKQMDMVIDKKLGKEVKTYTKQNLIELRNSNFEKYKKSIEKGKTDLILDLKIGDKVLIFREAQNNKLSEKWWADYVIIGQIKNEAFLVKSTKSNSEIRVNKRHIKKDMSFLKEGDVVGTNTY